MPAETEKSLRLVEASGLSKSFASKLAVCSASFAVAPGEVLGFIGANGGGKTTTLRLIAGLVKADEGSLTVLGRKLPDQKSGLRRVIGYVSQNQSLYGELTVRENLSFHARTYGAKTVNKSVDDAVKQFRLKQYAETRVRELSGGWARLAQLAAGVIHRPRLLLLDEPTAGLDASAQAAVWQHIRAYGLCGAGVIVSTHDLDEAVRCDNVVYFSDGAVLASGPPHALIDASSARAILIKNNNMPALLKKLDEEKFYISRETKVDGVKVVVPASAQGELEKFASLSGSVLSPISLTFRDASMALSQEQHHEG